MVTIPTGIISAGFVEQYTSIKRKTEYGYEAHMRFIKINLINRDRWVGKSVSELELPAGVILAVIRRKEKILIPRGNTILKAGDTVVLGAKPFKENEHINLKEIVLQKQNPWTGERIRDLDISRHSIIVLIKRGNKTIIPNGNTVLREGDSVFLYTQLHLASVSEIEL